MTYFWNKNRDQFICLDKVRNFEVRSEVTVIAWFSDIETIEVGKFYDREHSTKFLENLEVFSFPKDVKND